MCKDFHKHQFNGLVPGKKQVCNGVGESASHKDD